jgi:hypothetical protein
MRCSLCETLIDNHCFVTAIKMVVPLFEATVHFHIYRVHHSLVLLSVILDPQAMQKMKGTIFLFGYSAQWLPKF